MHVWLLSLAISALAEMGDKTQLVALALAARFRKPLPVLFGILSAMILNNALAGAVGIGLRTLLPTAHLKWTLGAAFLVMAIWILIPDHLKTRKEKPRHLRAFGATFLAFFVAEMGDKTQITTIALTARFGDYVNVVTGTTLGMLIMILPAVLFGDRFARRVPAHALHGIVAVLFLVLGAALLLPHPPEALTTTHFYLPSNR